MLLAIMVVASKHFTNIASLFTVFSSPLNYFISQSREGGTAATKCQSHVLLKNINLIKEY